MCLLWYACISLVDVTVGMVRSTITQDEGDGSVSVCARVSSPLGGLGQPVTVTFTATGQQTGTGM